MNDLIPPDLINDIHTAIFDLESIRTSKNRDKIVWAQYVLTACSELVKTTIKQA